MIKEHTPGPWKTARYNEDRASVEIETVKRGRDLPDHGYFIALVGAASKDDPNARLIAAAPELLEALRKISIIEWSSVCAVYAVDEMQHIARAAIAMAEGRSDND